MLRRLALAAAIALASGLVVPLRASNAATPKLLDYHAYSAWRRVPDVRVSREGRRLAYAEVAAEADGELIVRDLTRTATFRAPRGRAPQFSADSRFVVYRIAPPVADVRAADRSAAEEAERPKDGLGIADVGDVAAARATDIARVRSFALACDGAVVAYLLEPSPSPAASTSPAASPVGGGEIAHVADVAAYALSADGSRIAYVVQTKADESIHVRDLAGDDRTIAHGTAHLTAPVLSPDGATLAYLANPTRTARPR